MYKTNGMQSIEQISAWELFSSNMSLSSIKIYLSAQIQYLIFLPRPKGQSVHTIKLLTCIMLFASFFLI